MSRALAFALATATLATVAVPAVAQTINDTTRLQQAQDRVNRELSIYRNQSARGGYNRNGAVRGSASGQRLDQELSNLRVEIDRYQSLVRNSSGYSSNGYSNGSTGYTNNNGYNNGQNGYSTNNGYNNGQYADNSNDDPNYDASRYYRDGNNYQERELSQNDRVYKGNDGRYYCKRNDGTTGLIVGALGGGVLGSVIGGRSGVVGTILGALGGAVAGRAVDRNGGIPGVVGGNNSVRCR